VKFNRFPFLMCIALIVFALSCNALVDDYTHRFTFDSDLTDVQGTALLAGCGDGSSNVFNSTDYRVGNGSLQITASNANAGLQNASIAGGIDWSQSGSRTVSYWVKWNEASAADQINVLLGKFGWAYASLFLGRHTADGASVYVYGGGDIYPSFKFSSGTWHFVTFVYYTNKTGVYYVNGTTQATVTFSHTLDYQSGSINIGKTGCGSAVLMTIDDLRLYDRALTQSEILSLSTYNGVDAALETAINITAANITSNQYPIYVNSTLLANCQGVNSNGQNLNYTARWFINGSLAGTYNSTAVTPAVLANVFNFTPGRHFTNLTLECTAKNSTNVSTSLNSSIINVLNFPPLFTSASTVLFYDAQIVTSAIVCSSGSLIDIDNDSITARFNWYIDNGSSTGITASNGITPSTLGARKGQKFFCSVNATDGYNITIQYAPVSNVINNHAPTLYTDISFLNQTGHKFLVWANVSDYDQNYPYYTPGEIRSTTIISTNATCLNILNATKSDLFGSLWNCTSTMGMISHITINFTDTNGSYIASSEGITGVPNIAPEAVITSPTDYDHNNVNLTIGYTYSDADSDVGTCYLYVNNILNVTNSSVASGTSITNTIVTGYEGDYTYFVNCTDGYATNTTTSRTYTFDSTMPSITWHYPLLDNSSRSNTGKYLNFTANDLNLYAVGAWINYSNGSLYVYTYVENLVNQTEYNKTFNMAGLTKTDNYIITACAADSHTATDFKAAKKIESDINLGTLLFQLDTTDKDFKLKDITSTKLKDRYTFGFGSQSNKKDATPQNYTFQVSSTQPIKAVIPSQYKGHMVSGKYWVDFETLQASNVLINRIWESAGIYYAEVIVTSASGLLEFNSLGGLNEFCQTVRYNYDITGPVCTVSSRTPSKINQSSTGQFQVILNCTDSSGINVTKTGDHYWAITTSTLEGLVTPGVPNRWSIRPPANNIAQTDPLLSAYGPIFRAQGRGEGYWYDALPGSDRNNLSSWLLLDNYSYAVDDGEYNYLTVTSINSTFAVLNFTSPSVRFSTFRQNIPLSYESLVNAPKYNATVGKTASLLVQRNDLEAMKGSLNYTIIAFRNVRVTATAPSSVLRAFYCNSSYSPAAGITALASPNCVLINSITPANLAVKVLTDRNSSYSQGEYSVINGKIGGIVATPLHYYYYDTLESNPNYAYRYAYANGSTNTNTSFSQTGRTWTSSNSGATWTLLPATLDLMEFTSKSGQDEFQFGYCAYDLLGNLGCNSTVFTDDITPTNHPISSPAILTYNSSTTLNDVDLTGTHYDMMNVRIGCAKDPDSVGNVTHSLTLRNSDGSLNYTINNSFLCPSDAATWITWNSSLAGRGISYRMNVTATSGDNPLDVQTFLTAQNFSIKSTPVVTSISPPSGSWYRNSTLNYTCNATNADGGALTYAFYYRDIYSLYSLYLNSSNSSFTSAFQYFYIIKCEVTNDKFTSNSVENSYFNDYTPPFFNITSINATSARNGDSVYFSVLVSDVGLLNYSRFEHNDSGTWVNTSLIVLPNEWMNVTAMPSYILNVTAAKGKQVCGRFWANDDRGNANESVNACFTTINSQPYISLQPAAYNISEARNFVINATAYDADGASDITGTAAFTTIGSCVNFLNTTSGNYFTSNFNCSSGVNGATLTYITFTDSNLTSATTDSISTNYNNLPPSKVNITYPANNSTLSGTNVVVTWNGYDPNGDTLYYTLYFGMNASNLPAVTTTTNSYYSVEGLTTGTYYLNLSVTDGTATNNSNLYQFSLVGPSLLLNATNNYVAVINTFDITLTSGSSSISGNTTNGSLLLSPSLNVYSYVAHATGYPDITGSLTISQSMNYTLNFLSANSIIVNIYYTNGSLASGLPISLDFLGNSNYLNASTSTGTYSSTYLPTDTYVLTYGASGYYAQRYYFTISGTSSQYINLYLEPIGVTSYTATVYDTLSQVLVGYDVILQKYNVGSGTYTFDQMSRTNAGGKATVYPISSTTWYKAVVKKGNDTLLVNSPSTIASDFNLYVDLNNAPSYPNFGLISRSLTYVNSSGGYFSYFWNDVNGNIVGGCLRVAQYGSQSYFCNQCVNTISGTITCAVNSSNASIISATGSLVWLGIDYPASQLTMEWPEESPFSKTSGPIFAFLIIGTVALLGMWHPIVAVLFSMAAMGGVVYFGLLTLPWINFTFIMAVGVIIIWRLVVNRV
jgi:hypothetical protein